MKKTLLFTSLIAVLSSAIFAITGGFETISAIYDIPQEGRGQFVDPVNFNKEHLIDNVELKGDEITVISKVQRLGLVSMGNTVQVGSGNKYSPVVKVTKFNVTQMTAATESYPINLVDITGKTAAYTIMDAVNLGTTIGTNTTDPRLESIKTQFPNAFLGGGKATSSSTIELAANYGFGSYTLTSYDRFAKLDERGFLKRYFYDKVLAPERPFFGVGDYKLFPWGIDFYNAKRKTITLPVGCNRKELKNQFYKEIAYVTHGLDGKIVNQTIVKFDFTKDHEFIDMVDNASTGEKQLVAVLGNRMYMGKQNDPEPNKFTLLVLNPDGTQKILKDFQHGLKGTEFMPVFAYMDGDITYLVSRNKLNATLETFVFDEKGELTIQKRPYKELMEMTYGAKTAAMGFTAGSQKYKSFGLQKLASGNLLLLTDDVHMETIPNPNAVAGSTMNQTINVPRYKNVVAFEFTPAGECKGQYVINKDFVNITIPTIIEKVIVKNHSIILLGLDKRSNEYNPYSHLFKNNDQYIQVGCLEACRPAIMIIDTQDKKATVTKVAEPLFNTLYGSGSYYVLNNETSVAYYGFKVGDNVMKFELQVQLIKF